MGDRDDLHTRVEHLAQRGRIHGSVGAVGDELDCGANTAGRLQHRQDVARVFRAGG